MTGKLMLVFLFSMLLVAPGKKEKIEQAIKGELKHFPEARLRDIYKNFFQDAFGPGHLIPDTTRAGSYLNYELQQPIGDTLTWQAIGPENNYYRINLRLVKDGTLPRSVLLEAMVESAKLARNPEMETWKKEWQETMNVMEKMNLQFPDFEKDKKEIEALFEQDEYVMHHSEHYNETYQRHYRIIHKTVFNRWKGIYF